MPAERWVAFPSRRSLLTALAGGLTACAGWSAADARHKRRRKKRRNMRKRHNHGDGSGRVPDGNEGSGATAYTGFAVSGRQVLAPDGAPVTLRGVNRMSVWDYTDQVGERYFPQIALSGANSVRIVWKMTDLGAPTSVPRLEALIGNCRAQRMLPMVELHDATGNLAGLPALGDYWTRDDELAALTRQQDALLVNIGNEVGNDTVTTAQWIAAYTPVIRQMRAAGIAAPLVIDAPDWGKNLGVIVQGAGDLLAIDPNLIFSVHTYWPKNTWGHAGYIATQFDAAHAAGMALIVGEFSRWGAYNNGGSPCAGNAEVDYASVMEQAASHGFGWYVWSWGPGNEHADPLCMAMNMTTDGTFAGLQPGWATAAAARIRAEATPLFH